MDTVTSVTNNVLGLLFSMLPHVWQAVLGFLIGCWFYRYLLKRNPSMLQKLVDLVNASPAIVESAVGKTVTLATAMVPNTTQPSVPAQTQTGTTPPSV